jgi:Beta-galactosidase
MPCSPSADRGHKSLLPRGRRVGERRRRIGPAVGAAVITAVGRLLCGTADADRLVLPKSLEPTGSIEAAYRFDRPATGHGFLDVEWSDVVGRIVAQRRIPLMLRRASEVAFPLDLRRAVTVKNKLVARLSLEAAAGNGAPVRREREERASFIVSPSASPWSDYQIIMWQPQAPAAWAALKRLGITAGMVKSNRRAEPNAYVRGQIAALLDSDMRWYLEDVATDFYSPYHKWSKDRPVNWRFRAAKARYWANPRDLTAFVRKPGLSDPRWLEKIRNRLIANVRAFRRYRPLFYNLADEPGIADLSAFWDFDRSSSSLAAMRAWLKSRYGSLARLDQVWGAAFRSWREVMPMTTDEAMRRGNGNFAAWADFKEWMDVAFARALKSGTEAVHAADPSAVSAIEGAQIPGWGGYDYWRLARSVDAMELYDHGENVELLRSFNPNAIMLTTSFRAGPAEAHRVWRELLRGTRGLILWDSTHGFVGKDGAIGERGREAASYFREIRGGLGALLIHSERRLDKVAILYSPASWRLEWLLDHKGKGWSRRSASSEYADDPIRMSIRRSVEALEHRGVQPRFVSTEGVEKGELATARDRVLILPQTIALSAAAAAQIRGFIDDGGVVLADGKPGIFDEEGRKRRKPALAPVFADPSLGATRRLRLGQGKAISFAAPASSDCDGRQRLAGILAAAGVEPLFPLTRGDGGPVDDVETYVFRNGGVTILALLPDLPGSPRACSRAAEPSAALRRKAVIVRFPRPYEVYDVRARRALGMHSRLAVRLDSIGPTILALAEKPLPAPSISGPQSVHLGENALFRISAAGASAAAHDVIHFAVSDPEGRIVPYYSGNLIARGAAASTLLPLALDDPAGIWHIRARDLLTGATATAEFAVTP